MAVGLLHDGGRITRCVHVLFNDSGQEFKVRGGCGGLRLRKIRGRRAGRRSGNFIQTDCNRLAEIHRWLVGMRRNLNEGVAPGEVLAGEAVFFRTEDEGDAAAAGHLLLNERSQVMQFDHRLLGLAIGECSCPEDERAVPDGFGEEAAIRAIHRGRHYRRAGENDKACVAWVKQMIASGINLAALSTTVSCAKPKLARARAAAPILSGFRGETRTTRKQSRWA